MKEYMGKTCPYCKTKFVEGDDVVVCSQCEMPHHKECWVENSACTTFGCMGTIQGFVAPTPGMDYAPQAQPQYQQPQYQQPQYQQPQYQQPQYQQPQYQQPQYQQPQYQQPQYQQPQYQQPQYRQTQPNGVFCRFCGANNVPGNRFCIACGNAIAPMADSREETYQKALFLYGIASSKEEWSAVSRHFEGLGAYKDSIEKAEYCNNQKKAIDYSEATVAFESAKTPEDYHNAAKLFAGLGAYLDSTAKSVECLKAKQELENLTVYEEAQKKADEGTRESLVSAGKLFLTIKDYKDSENRSVICVERIKNIDYSSAISKFENAKSSDDCKSAGEIFKKLGGYLDSEARLEACMQRSAELVQEERYTYAMELYESATESAKAEEAKTVLLSLGEYKDAPERAEQAEAKAKTLAENERKDKAYDYALNLYSLRDINELRRGVELFEKIKDWRDSKEQIERFEKRIAELEAIEREAQEEAERLRKKKKRKIIAILTASIAAVLATVIILLTVFVFLPAIKMSEADACFENQQYDQAKALYIELGEKAAKKLVIITAVEELNKGNINYAVGYLLDNGVPVELSCELDGGEFSLNEALIAYRPDGLKPVADGTKDNVFLFNTKEEYSSFKAPSRNGYIFGGWSYTKFDFDIKNIDGTFKLSLTSRWNEKSFSLRYELGGGILSEQNPDEYKVGDADIVLVNPTREGYSFTGWTGTGLTTPTLEVKIPTGSIGNRDYTANWAINEYTISYDAAGGSVSSKTQNIAYGGEVKYLVPTRDGCYEFLGWYNGDTLVEDGVWLYTSDVELIAKWKEYCPDTDKNHECDKCGAEIGEHVDKENDNDHLCDYCGEVISECFDNDKNHSCDECGYLSDCEDKNGDHKCDVCEDTLSTCVDADTDHACDICGANQGEHFDVSDDEDHLCEYCGKVASYCVDADKDHACDDCGYLSDCEDKNGDHKCDVCEDTLSTCVDVDTDHACDICGANQGEHFDVSDDEDHLCEYCGKVASYCVDADKDHACDDCGAEMGTHADSANDGDHLCEYCGKAVSTCADLDRNHACDDCGAEMGTHADSANDGDHVCDYGCGAILTSCADSDNNHECDECGATLSTCTDSNKDHACDDCGAEMGTHADSANDGDHLCDYCGEKMNDCVDANSDNYCDECGKKVWVYTRDGDKITFGSYPQSEVTDSGLIATLNTKAGTLPTSSDSQAWTSYGYYIDGSVSNFMWYIDVEEGGEKYRGVYFTSYRPELTTYSSSEGEPYQDDNGYTTSTVYWFKYEPISWTILSENTTDATALILCDMIIDSQAYQNEHEYNSSAGENYNTSDGVPSGTYANNYAHSTIRKWLNETFYNTAFSELQKQIILTTTVDNSVASTGDSSNSYACENTEDKVFLLSVQEVTNTAYGFASSTYTYDTAREKQTTDYAKAQGTYTSTSTDYVGNGWWWLRSPLSRYSYSARGVNSFGRVNDCYYVSYTTRGVVPALQIRL